MLKKRTLIYVVAVVGVITVAVLFFFHSDKPVQAEVKIAEPQVVIEDTSADEPGQVTKEENATAQVEMTVEQIAAYGEELTAKAGEIYLTPGWLHIAYENESFLSDPRSVLPDGTPVPTKSVTDKWLFLNDEDYVVEEVTIDDTGDPATTQIVVFRNGVVTNLTFPTLTSEQEAYQLHTLGRLNFDALTIRVEDGQDLDLFETEVDGEAVVVFSRSDRYDPPVTFGKSPTQISETIHQYSYLKATGLPFMAEKYYVYPSGERVLKQRTTYVTFEKVDAPPAEILTYLEEE
ncbi:MAG: hypothetical protein WA110_02940 [Anaerolineaceae bacterium]